MTDPLYAAEGLILVALVVAFFVAIIGEEPK